MTDRQIAVVLLSGGLDSMVTAALAQERGYLLYALTIDYNQRHKKEIEAARKIASHLNVEAHLILPLDLRQFGGSALTGNLEVPKDGLKPGVPVTYVPARNLIFLSLAIGWAETVDAQAVFIGVNAVDYSGYPDCRPDFINSFIETAQLGTTASIRGINYRVEAPLQYCTKAQIAAECLRLNLDPSFSWSCYDPPDDRRACGLCDSCRLRQKGFLEANVFDGTVYAA